MRNWIGVGCVAFGWVVACGSSDSQSDTPKDSGSDVTTDASLDAGACEPTGSWIWQSVSEGGTPKDDHVLVEAAPGGWCMDKYQTDYQMSGQKQ